ncbi:hypothetical protein EI94DRAFT_1801011 [Lactarius quietus]|nr:hypothetical protein EI94DRAFT_1801011 [Lactarius quietus]
MHTLVHSFDNIEAKGASRNYNMKPNKKLHGPLKKSYTLQTNFKNFARQILRFKHMTFVSVLICSHINELEQISREANEGATTVDDQDTLSTPPSMVQPEGPELQDPAPSCKQHKCLHEHWKNCQDYPEANTWEAHDQKDIEEEEAIRALVAAEDDSYLAYEEACRVRQLVSNMITRGMTPDAGRKVIAGRMKVT